jgi:glycerol-3-phosphate acyltransferase PlsY
MIVRIVSILIGYLFGCFQTAFIIGKLVRKTDIREHGSGNSGTTNAIRVFGWKMGAVTFFTDILKAVLAVLTVRAIYGEPVLGMYAAFGVVIGHVWPVFLKFRGGKGIASTVGGMLAVNPILGLIMVVIMAITVIITQYVSLGSILTVLAIPIYLIFFSNAGIDEIVLGSFITMITLYKHRANISRLLKGEENKLGHKKDLVKK